MEPSCYRVAVTVAGHHAEFVVGAMSESEAAGKAYAVASMFWKGNDDEPLISDEPLITDVTRLHLTSEHGSGPERRERAGYRRR